MKKELTEEEREITKTVVDKMTLDLFKKEVVDILHEIDRNEEE